MQKINTPSNKHRELKALIFDIKRDCSEDGPGIRSTVFFKGCPLSCSWCQNPEAVTRSPALSYRKELCTPEQCGVPCVDVCPTESLKLVDKTSIQVNHDLCKRCGLCFEVCPTQALEPVGSWFTVKELLYRVLIDKPFFQTTGGGVTVSGGEATLQTAFLTEFLQGLKAEGIHTALETSGFFNLSSFQKHLLPKLDLIYFDIKLINEEQHRQYTGQSNRPILANLSRLSQIAEIPIIVRTPLIPEITATAENLAGIADFLRSLNISNVELLPYNPLWQDKLPRFGLRSNYENKKFMSTEEQDNCVNYFLAKKPD